MRTWGGCLLGALAVGLASCRQHDYRVARVHIPPLRNQACAEVIMQKALNRDPGIKTETANFNIRERTLSVTYDSMKLAMKNIEFFIAEAGFAANDVPADARAAQALPPECLAE